MSPAVLDGYKILASFIARNRGQLPKSSTLLILAKNFPTRHGIKGITHARWTRPFCDTQPTISSRKDERSFSDDSIKATTTTSRNTIFDLFGAHLPLTIFEAETFTTLSLLVFIVARVFRLPTASSTSYRFFFRITRITKRIFYHG